MGYDAFISYSHSADLELAPAVRDALQRLAKPWNRRRALSVFLDQASLEVSAELGTALDDRIKDTRWLVLFMSTESAQSKWVGAEIAEWVEKKSKDRLALVLTSGEVVWDDEARDFDYERSTAVSQGMRGVYTGQESEPLFLDLTWTKTDVADGEKSLDLTHARFKNDIATIAAPIHGIPKDELVGEDVRQFKLARRLRRAAVTGLAVLTVAAVTFGIVARIQRNRSEARRLAVVSEANASEQTDLALLLALESLDTTETDEGWGALFTALSRPVLARSPLVGHQAGVNRLLFSPDGSVLASMGGDGSVGLWDPSEPEAMRQIGRLKPEAKRADGHQEEPEGRVSSFNFREAAFSPDGSMLATPGDDGTVRLWDVDRGVQLGEPLQAGDEAAVWDVAFSPDGRLLATASADSTVRLWDLDEPKQRGVETMGTQLVQNIEVDVDVWEVEFSKDGSRFLWVSSDGSLRSRPVAAGSEVELLLAGHVEWSQGSTAPGVAFSNDRKKIAVASGDWTVQVWDLAADPPTVQSLKGHDGFVVDLAFSPDDARLASASQDRTVRLWDVAAGEQTGNTLTGHDAEVFSVGFSGDGSLLVSGSGDRTVRVWDLGAGGGVGRQLDHGGWVRTVSISPNGSLAASGGDDSKISLWDVASGRLLRDIEDSHGKDEWVNSVTFSSDGKLLASAGDDGSVRLWNAGTGLPFGDELAGHRGYVRGAEFSPNGKSLASAGGDLTVLLWEPGSDEPVEPPLEGHEEVVLALAFSPDGKALATAGSDATVRLWAVGTGKQLGEKLVEHDDAVLDVRFAPGGEHLLSVSRDGLVLRWNLLTREAEEVLDAAKVLDGATEWTAAAFNGDGSVMASAAPDGSIRRWDLESGTQAGRALLGHSKRVEAVDFGPDASVIASASEDGTVRLWPAESRWRDLACAAVGRNLTAGEWEDLVGAERRYRRQCAPHEAGNASEPNPEPPQ